MKVTEFEFQDWLIVTLVTAAWTAATVYLFKFHSVGVFASWCGLAGTLGGVYHWLMIKDSKQKDAQ